MGITTGTKLGRYEIRSKIGEGGMGEVYRAYDEAIRCASTAFRTTLPRFISIA